jgi:hypothetical protein
MSQRPVNQGVAVVATFGPDPNATPMNQTLPSRLQGYLQSWFTPYVGPSEVNPGRFWPGYAPSPQSFVGMAGSGGSAVVYRTGAYPQTDSAVIAGPLGDPSRRIFAERLARRQGSV